ncbi:MULTISPECIES: methylmalonyl-CoA decarboxylase [Pseudomonas]|uniref:Methylmalonyl-CoA decarboxylase n=1 Tax=Pseudomonas putida TaxID=303 RepID=A0A2S3XE49_PSEPU|nr:MULTISPECIES: methylmalonyl-CoA decarboxylase [Pseudomonas]AVD83832.1 methylmalonyl-CoA decarboxylase [Pseudomonas sp. SWI6]AVD94999.1 methylmalonyl-CoA decarboxylase [Pseudomonas sp. SWI36]ELU0814762.1 methylmalonyl-CoA decarboxylase [Pseudomonas putida]MBH3388223.1 methylmalonyl-CoA decarboxylase [Pseudomonas putida]MCK2121437.1 methylmalonyl-CoA decarboxylase [Pseudomonas sp. PNPG3]
MATTDTPTEFVKVEMVDERIARLTFSNAARRNALSAKLLSLFEESLAALAAERVPVVIIGSEPGQSVWSAGHDIQELSHDRDPIAYDKPLERVLRNIRTYPGVVIAMVGGSAWGGAVDLAMTCDMVIADQNASFSMTPANIGLPYSTSGLLRFFNNLPIHLLKEMFFTASKLDAIRAAQFGVVNKLVDVEHLESTAVEFAQVVATKAPLAVQSVKEQLRMLEDMQPVPVHVMERIAELRKQACEGRDFTEGLTAFAERRPPQFIGQ